MPATKKKRKASAPASLERKVAKVSEQMNMLLVVFALAMMFLAYVLIKVYAQ